MRAKLFLVSLLLVTHTLAAQTLTDTIYQSLRNADKGAGDGSAYLLNDKSSLPADWLLQTPNVWGLHSSQVIGLPLCSGSDCDPNFQLPICGTDKPCRAGRCVSLRAANRSLCVGQSDQYIDRIYDVVAKGGTLIDISSLKAPDARFLAALRSAMTVLARSGKSVTVRVLLGAPVGDQVDIEPLRNQLVSEARTVRGSKLTLLVMAYRMYGESWYAWNHSKIIANDSEAIVGGHNMWTDDYLITNVVHDVSMRVDGPVVTASHQFLDRIWSNVCESSRAAVYVAETNSFFRGCPATPKAPQAPASGTTKLLAVGNYGIGVGGGSSSYMSDLARVEAIRQAKSALRFSQQDIALTLPVNRGRIWWPDETLQAIGDALIKNVHVYFVQSNYDAIGGRNGTYENLVPPIVTANKIAQVTSTRPKAPSGEALINMLCRNLHFATLRFNENAIDNVWHATGKPFGNHAKVWMVDDRAFYIGSDNVYPAWLQEYGYIVDDAAATKTLRDQYWDPLWKASERTAISGGAPGSICQLGCEVGTSPDFSAGYDNKPRAFADVNGDGKADYCRFVGKDQLSCAIARATDFDDGKFITREWFPPGYDMQAFADVNGDGKTDFCRFVGDSMLSCAIAFVRPGIGQGFIDGFGSDPKLERGWTKPPRAFIDVNGDRRADFCRLLGSGGDMRISCLLATATGFNGGTLDSPKGFREGYDNKPRYFVDIKGEGFGSYCRAVDNDVFVCATSDGKTFVDNNYATIGGFDFGSEPQGFADVNGDHWLDYCRIMKDGRLGCALAASRWFSEGWSAAAPFHPGFGNKPRGFYDVNGDGKADFCRIIDGDLLRCALSEGVTGGYSGTFKDTFQPLDHFTIGDSPWFFADVIGEASADFCRVLPGKGLSCAYLSVCHK